MKDEVALFNDAIAILRAHAVMLEGVARVVQGTDPWPADLEHWIRSEAITTDNATLAVAFHDAANSAEKSAGFIRAFLRDGNTADAIGCLITAASSVDMTLEHRVGLGGKGCATLPSANEVLADVHERFYVLFPQDGVEFYTPQFNAFTQWLATHPNPWA